MARHHWGTEQAHGAVVVDTVTRLDRYAAGKVVVSGSHGGAYPAALVAGLRVRAAVFNDAGCGKDEAGVAGLGWLAARHVPAVAVGHDTARIGDGADTLRRGVVRHANSPAQALGCLPGMPCGTAVMRLAGAPHPRGMPQPLPEARHRLLGGDPQVWALDSASLASTRDIGHILVTGSHGALLGGRPETACKAQAAAAVFNDAGIGVDGAGVTRLPVLAARGIPAATVGHHTARIGDGRSTYADGVLSTVNEAAVALGARPGMPTRVFVALVRTASPTPMGRLA